MTGPDESRVRAHVIVTGRVQGVWFRESTRRRANELGLSGWVRNLPDGRVEAEFEGPELAVRAALRFVEVGPEHARVDAVVGGELREINDPPGGSQQAFRVR
jgi:acylphosphatase